MGNIKFYSVLINAMPQRYATIKYFPCSRLAFFSIFQRAERTVAEINFPLFWCGVKHEIYFAARDANSGNENQVDSSANRVCERDGKQSSCSTVKFD